MYNYKSNKKPFIKEPIVVSFDKENNKSYSLGFSLNDIDDFVLQNVLVLQNKIHWKSSLSNDISVQESSNGVTTISNIGGSFLGNEIRIAQDTREQPYTYVCTKGSGHQNISFFANEKEINFEKIDTNHSLYTELKDGEDAQSRDVLTEDFASFVITDYEVIPAALHGQVFNSSTSFSKDDVYLLLDSDDDLTFLVSDYEVSLSKEQQDFSSIILMKNNETDAIYYDIIESDRLRFVISDYGRIISLAQHDKESDSFKKSKSLIFSSDKITDENQTVSLRLSSDIYNSAKNVTVNF